MSKMYLAILFGIESLDKINNLKFQQKKNKKNEQFQIFTSRCYLTAVRGSTSERNKTLNVEKTWATRDQTKKDTRRCKALMQHFNFSNLQRL